MAITVPPDSPKFSFRGWLFTEWLSKNKAWVKAPVVALFAYAAWAVLKVDQPELRAFLTAAVAVLARLGTDASDYWISEISKQ